MSRICADCGKPTITENDVWCHDCGREHWYGSDEPDRLVISTERKR